MQGHSYTGHNPRRYSRHHLRGECLSSACKHRKCYPSSALLSLHEATDSPAHSASTTALKTARIDLVMYGWYRPPAEGPERSLELPRGAEATRYCLSTAGTMWYDFLNRYCASRSRERFFLLSGTCGSPSPCTAFPGTFRLSSAYMVVSRDPLLKPSRYPLRFTPLLCFPNQLCRFLHLNRVKGHSKSLPTICCRF